MSNNEFDQVLELLTVNKKLYKVSEEDLNKEVIKELIDEGLIKYNEENQNYQLTEYGSIIQVVGYSQHNKSSEDTELPKTSYFKRKLVLSVLVAVIVCLFIIIMTYKLFENF